MKTTGMMNRGGQLRADCRAAWALYYAKYLAAYRAEGIDIWGLSIQNEPEATQSWDSCVYTGEEERDFIRDHLGPTLEREGWGHIKLIIWDHNRDRVFERAKVVFDDPAAARYVWGTGFHWYVVDGFENIQRVHDAWPDKALIFTEGCVERYRDEELSGHWRFGEKYGQNVLHDLNRWTVAWCDWNLLLDETGGPNHVGNFCSAPIMVDTRVPGGQIVYQSSYYYLGHFARFIRPGAVRISAAATLDELETTAFLNPDGRIAAVVLNRSDKAIPFALKFRGRAGLTDAPPHSITTYCFAADA
jgi:glucosylceramidase